MEVLATLLAALPFWLIAVLARKQPDSTMEVRVVTFLKWGGMCFGVDQKVGEMLGNGWELQNPGSTLSGAALRGGLSLLLAGSRRAETMTLIFKRPVKRAVSPISNVPHNPSVLSIPAVTCCSNSGLRSTLRSP